MSTVVKSYLDQKGLSFQVTPHRKTGSSLETASAAHIQGDHLAKAVLLDDGQEYLMVVIPADSKVDLKSVADKMGKEYEIAPESRVEAMLQDCDPGAIPPIGHAYGMETLVDSSFDSMPDVYFESGDHEHLVHVDGLAFNTMLADCPHGQFSLSR
jgi:Ala-tRNA(Pro) deacylase